MTKKTVALVLGAGGARGYAHIGAIEEIERRGYAIRCVAGCSMGAVVGGIYAAGRLDEYRQWIERLDYLDILRLVDVSFRMGAIRGDKVFGQIRRLLGDLNIEDLRIPYTAVATDLTHQKEVWFQEGCLHQAMRASAAIPSLFTPVMIGNRTLVDGGLLNPLPIVPVVASHCDLVVAVNLNGTSALPYEMPMIERPAAFRSRFDRLLESLNSRLPSRRRQAQAVLQMERNILSPTSMAPAPWFPEDLCEPLPETPVQAFADGADEQVVRVRPRRRPPLPDPDETAPTSATDAVVVDAVGPASLLDLVNQSFEVMQTSLAQYKIAGYPPDVLIEVPKRVCRFFEFYKAPELIALGRRIARDAFDRYEGRR
ncbi:MULTISPECIES: patatin-like phospholipase family protein [Pseudomonas]|uniref:Alpha/beta hydrolase n=1 Tax=Pseudomonas quercus TaxID=2722792 RepID=A0ABX0YCT4_9PSED|nr:patatin-like phospholipase family protein [Pseudomonas sp. LY10J]MBF7141349.1 patatin-like phospholipase family protein [Pseudomonas sp. LY10J]NJO99887.1 alpha/beta hydrolase [Pseudomonas quercus]